MSKTIDERIVSMEFDNKNFETNVRESMSTLDKLKQALNFKGATTGLEAIDSASKKVNFSAMGKAVDEIGVRFSGLQVIATTALANITNSVVNAGKQMVSSLAFQPLTSGFQEYETQIGSIQTILSNTRWQNTSLDQVNSALDELNTYADKTIYNFTEMTRNIGTFTAAGVGLDQSVSAIKGIANLAAVSGSTSQQASTAMYQLSQALAAGRVSLMDWNSVVNAGMGGKVFQDALIRTSELMGTGAKQAIEAYGSFRESLTKGQWLTTDVLTETLAQISGAYSEADLIAQGYTQSQAAEIVALAKDAEGAATNVKTFTQLIDTTMEALGSGWTNTFELIVGDFEESKQLWTDVSNYLNDVVNQSAESRNNLLQGWRDLGGREALLEGLKNVFDALLSVIEPIQEVFSEFFPPATAESLMDLTNKFKDFTAGLKLSSEATENLKSVVRGILSFFEMLLSVAGNVIDFFGHFTQYASGAFDVLGDFAVTVGDLFTTLNEGMQDGTAFNTVVEKLGTAFGEAATGVSQFLSSGIGKLGDVINSITPDQINTFLNALATGAFLTFVKDIKDNLTKLGDEAGSFSDVFTDAIKELTGGFSESITGVLDAVKDALVAWQQNIKANALLKIAIAVALLANAVGQLASLDSTALKESLGAVTVLFGELIGTMALFEKISAGLSFGASGALGLIAMAAAIKILAGALVDISGLNSDAITRGVEGIAQLAAIMVLASKVLSMGDGPVMKGAVQLVVMAAALKILASVVNDLAALDMDKMAQGLEGVGVLLAEIAAFDAWVNGGKDLMTASISMIFIGTAMKILASSVSDLGNLETGKAVQGIVAIGAIFGEIAALSHLVDGDKLLKSFVPIIGISLAIVTIAQALSKIAAFDGAQIANAVGAIGIVLGELALFSYALPDTKKLNSISAALPSMALSLVIFAAAIRLLSDLNIEQIGVAVAGFAGSMASLFIGIKAVSGNEKQILVLMLAATALTVMAAAIKLLSTVGVVGVAVSLATLAGTFIILGGAAKLLGPLAPSMFKIAAAVAAFGGSLIALGIGSAAIGVGLSVTLTALVTTLANLQGAISSLDPMKTAIAIGILIATFGALAAASYFLAPIAPIMLQFAASIAAFGLACAAVAGSIWLIVAAISALGNLSTENVQNGITNFTSVLTGIIDAIPQLVVGIMNSLKSLLLGALDVLVEVAPQMADSVLTVIEEVLASLNEHGPAIIDFILSFLIQIINGVAGRVPELVGAIGNLLDQLFTAIFDAMTGWTETETGTEAALKFLAGATGLVIAFNAIKGMIPGAMAGALGMAAFIVEVGAILAALGALEQLTGASSFINSGGDLLQSIGTAIGQFLGGIVGGFAEGATSTLPQIGQSLSQFAINLVPFLTTMSMIDQSAIDSAVNLAGAIAALTGANLLDQLGSFLTGGSDFTDLGEKLIPFGEAMVSFSNVVQGIDVAAVNAAANCGQALATLASSLPKEGGLAQAIFGETTDLSDFATQMVQFGLALKMFGTTVVGLNVEDITAAAQAGQALSDLANTLPKDGGLAQAIFGETTDMDAFGTQIVAFGEALQTYAGTVADLDVESINTSVAAGQALSDLATALPDSGGLVEWLFGGSDLGTFGQTLSDFGGALKSYSDSLTEVDFGIITQSVTAVRSLAQVATEALSLDTSGVETLTALSGIGDAIYDYWSSISTVDTASLASSIQSLVQLKDLIASLVGFDTSGVSSFTAALTSLGQASLGDLTALFDNANFSSQGTSLAQTFVDGFTAGMSGASDTISSAISGLSSSLSASEASFSTSGNTHASKFAEGIQNGVSTVTEAVSSMVTSAVGAIGNNYQAFFDAGSNLALGFANGIRNSAYAASIQAAAMANAAVRAAQVALDEHSPSKVMRRIGEYAGQGFVLGVGDFVAKSEKAGEKLAQGVIDGASLKSLYESFGDLEGVYKNLTALSKKYEKQKKKDTKTTEEETEETSKLSEVLSTVADDVQKLIDRRNDLRAIDELLSGTANLSRGFVAELLDSSGKYAGAISEMTKLTTDQLNMLSAVYDESKLAENMEELANTLSESLQSVYDGYARLGALQKLFSRGINFGRGFISELINSSGQYADVLVGMADLTEEQLKRIEDAFNEQKTIDNMNNLIDTVSEMMMSIQDRYDRIDALNTILSNKNLNLSEEFIAELKDSSGEYADILTSMVDLTEEQIKQLEAIYNENIRLDNIEKVIDKISELEKEVLDLQNFDSRVNSILDKAGGTVSNAFANELKDADGEFKDFLDAFEDATGAMIKNVSDLFTLKKFYTNLNTLEDAIDGNHGLGEAFEKAETDITGFAVAVTNCGLDMEEVIGKITEFADKVSDGFNKIEVSSQTGLSEFLDNIKNNLIYAEEWATNLDKVIDVARGVSGGMDFINKVLEGGIDQYGRIIAEMANLSEEGIKNVINTISGSYSSAASYGIGIANSYMDYSGRAFEDVGKALGIGVTSGITTGVEAGTSNVIDSVKLMCNDIEDTTTSYFGIHSPSKLMASIGKNIVAGLSNGITNARNWVIDAVSTINSYLSDVDTSVNDMTVKITPVIDYTEYDKKLAVLSSDYAAMLSPTTMDSLESVIRLSGQNGINDATKRLADAVDRLENKVASINPDNFGVTYQQINNSPTPLSTATIYRQTRNQISLAKNRNGKSFNN